MGLEFLGLLILGFISAIVAYLLGVGGGALIVPILVVFFNYPVHEAVAVSLVVIIASSLSITSVNLLRNQVNVKLGVSMEFAAIVGAVSGGMASINLSEKVLSTTFATIMFITAFIMWKKSEVETSTNEKPEEMGELDRSFMDLQAGELKYYKVKSAGKTTLVAFLAGITSGMLGLGGGVFKVPAMNIISKVPIKAATATSNFMICFTAAAGSVPYLLNGYLHPGAAGTMVIGVFAGSKFATGRLSKVQNKNIKMLFILFVLLVASQMAYKAVFG
ncbi:MAG: hypothetical protein C0603_08005 [Denitrovibrio sp.]|nr:MAG: hypothetical protein C0603_08005 [Denitrovibrio sp.]